MRNCLVIDLDRCTGCDTCVVSCKYETNLDLGVCWNRVGVVGPNGEFPDIEQYYLPVQCQQCANPQCVKVCPTGASYRDEKTNVVLVDKSKCIGCRYCMMACPYDVRVYREDAHVVEKCTLCSQRTQVGELPACVVNCCAGARMYGNLDDPTSDVAKAVAAAGPDAVHNLPDPGDSKPATVYILHDDIAHWKELN